MRALVQRVLSARVDIDGMCVGSIGKGLLIFLGVGRDDDSDKVQALARRIPDMRIFEDQKGKMNLSLKDLKAEILIVSQFTLYANCNRGRRPDFTQAAPPELAKSLYEEMIACFREAGFPTQTGVFGADMKVSLVNDGPVTFFLEQ